MRDNEQKSASTQDGLNSFIEADVKLGNVFLYMSDWGRKGGWRTEKGSKTIRDMFF